jgi:Uma2 family endonuclease
VITLRPVRPVTDQELMELSERNPEYQFERSAAGELIVTPTSGRSAQREAKLVSQLDRWAERQSRGVVLSPTAGFRLPNGEFYLPDAAWVRRDRWDALPPDARDEILHLCPDAAFEIRAKSSRLGDLREKMRAYLANGVQIAVLIDPYERIVEVYRPRRQPEIHRDPANVALDPELKGFALELAPLFAE